jgi:PhzF family phenazine biosynthesis protein
MRAPIFQVDAFTDRPFAGNPAGVCILPEERDDAWLAAVAAEMNLSETAFLRRENAAWRLRWFSPTVEVALCGHATLASAHALWEAGYADSRERLVFHTKSGELSARRQDGAIELDFPAEPADARPAPPGLLKALGLAAARFTGRNRFDWLVEAGDASAVRGLAPDLPELSRAGGDARGVIVTAASDQPEFDFVSRFFAPATGIDEDPVTGSAHCCLGPYWGAKLGKKALVGFQASRRGGVVRVRDEGPRVALGGTAVTILRGELA